MTHGKKFDPKHLSKLNDPKRLEDIPVRGFFGRLMLGDPQVIMDIGAGTGFFSVIFAELLKSGGILYACEISDVMLRYIRDNVCPKYPMIIPLKVEESRVPLEDQKADFIYMINLHHELESPQEILSECRRLLKKGGKLLIIDWKKEPMSEGPPHAIRYRPEDVLSQLKLAGFEDCGLFYELPKHFSILASKGRNHA